MVFIVIKHPHNLHLCDPFRKKSQDLQVASLASFISFSVLGWLGSKRSKKFTSLIVIFYHTQRIAAMLVGVLLTAALKIELYQRTYTANFIFFVIKATYNYMVMDQTTTLSTIETILAIIIALGTLVTMGTMTIKWMVKHYLGEIKQELKPNGGGSLKDQVNRLEARQDKADTLRKETYLRVEKLEKKIDDLYDKFIEYLSNQNK